MKINERKRINSNQKSSQKYNGDAAGDTEPDAKPKRPIDWDARDLKANGWVPGGCGKSQEGDSYKFWE